MLYTGPSDDRTLNFQTLGRLYGPLFGSSGGNASRLSLELDDQPPLTRGDGSVSNQTGLLYVDRTAYPFSFSFDR